MLFKIFMDYISWEQLQKFIVGVVCFLLIISIPLVYSFDGNSITLNNPYINIKDFHKKTKEFIHILKGEEFYPREMKLNKYSIHAPVEDIVKDIKLNTTVDDKILVFMDPIFVPIYDLSGNKPSHRMFFLPPLVKHPPIIEFLDTNPKVIVGFALQPWYKEGEYEQLLKKYELLKTYKHPWGPVGLYKMRE